MEGREIQLMPFYISEGNIVQEHTDAIVNAANTELLEGGGVCGVIFRAAGEEQLQQACEKLAPIATGDAVITPGFNLSASWIIHTAGPVYHPGDPEGSEALLRKAYLSSLNLAYEHHLSSISFPLISSGIYGYPKDEALAVAVDVIRSFLKDHEMEVHLVIFDRRDFRLKEEEKAALDQYLTLRLFDDLTPPSPGNEPFSAILAHALKAEEIPDLAWRSNHTIKGIQSILNRPNILPSKDTVLALAIGLNMTLDEAESLLAAAHYSLDKTAQKDGIIEYYLTQGVTDIFRINEALFAFREEQL
jgi:O-acetyl-ADP-ribose deacetylase (regulator of RNase III)